MQHWGGTLYYREWWWPFWVFERWSLDTFDDVVVTLNLWIRLHTSSHYAHFFGIYHLQLFFINPLYSKVYPEAWSCHGQRAYESSKRMRIGMREESAKDRWPAIRSTVVSDPQSHWCHILQMTWRRGAVVCKILQRKQWYMKLSFWAI